MLDAIVYDGPQLHGSRIIRVEDEIGDIEPAFLLRIVVALVAIDIEKLDDGLGEPRTRVLGTE